MAGKWMAKAFGNKGKLHRKLGVPEDKPIPQDKLDAAAAKANKTGDSTLSREVALANRAKSGDISKMKEGGVVRERPGDLIRQGLEEE